MTTVAVEKLGFEAFVAFLFGGLRFALSAALRFRHLTTFQIDR